MIPHLSELNLEAQRTFIRVDFNVPLDGDGKIVDDSRIRAALPTLQHALGQGAKVILASHLGRPKGKVAPQLSLMPIAENLSELLQMEVLFPEDCVGDGVRKLVLELKEGQVILLENLRFHPEEENNDPHFSELLARNADVYINDAFGTLHRAHASTVGMVPLVPKRAAGLLVEKEVEVLEKLMQEPDRPYWAILGGAKVSDKLGVLENLIRQVDGIMVAGAMAYTFLKAQGHPIGDSLVEESKIHQAAKILERAQVRDIPFLLPLDHVLVQALAPGAPWQTTKNVLIPKGWMGVDIGPQTVSEMMKRLSKAKTILWNGPVGVFEMSPFDKGTMEIARGLAKLKATTIVGGGDSVAAVLQSGVGESMSHLSTGGGATLEYLEGKTLPGLKALQEG